MIKINLLNDIKIADVPHERSEKEHKELVQRANDGVGAVKELKKHYGDLTIYKDDFGTDTLSDIDLEIEEVSFGVKE